MEKISAIKSRSSLRTKNRAKFDRDLPIFLILLPGMLLVLVFNYLPIYGIVIGFQNFSPFKGISGSDWVGLKHFKFFLSDPDFWRVMKNTIIINVYNIIFGMPIPLIFALLLNELKSIKAKKIFQTISYLPHFISWVIAAGMISAMLSPTSGIVNIFISKVFRMEPIYFLAQPNLFRSVLVASGVWKGFGMSSVYYLASISSIDTEIYEACTIDGGNRWHQMWYITIPGIKNMFIILLILQVGRMVSIGFEQVFLLYNPLVYNTGDVISTYTYRLGIEQTQFSLTTAIGFTQSIVNFILVYSTNKISKIFAGWSLW